MSFDKENIKKTQHPQAGFETTLDHVEIGKELNGFSFVQASLPERSAKGPSLSGNLFLGTSQEATNNRPLKVSSGRKLMKMLL